MKKVQALSRFCLIFSLMAVQANAEFGVVSPSGTRYSNTDSGGGVRSIETGAVGESDLSGRSTELRCDRSKDYAPYKLVRKLMANPSDFKVESLGGEDGSKMQVKVTMPPYYNTCLKLKLVPIKAEGQSLHIRLKMINPADPGKIYTYEKYTQCLKDTKVGSPVAKPVLDNGQFHAERSTVSDVEHLLFDLDIDTKKDVRVYFDSPYPSAENGNHGYVFGTPKDKVSCFKSEKFKQDGLVLYESPVTKAAKAAYEACASNNPLKIAQSIEDIGNASDLASEATQWLKILNSKLESSRADREKEIFDEIDAIANEFKELKKEGFQEDDEDLARENGKRVVKLLEELDDISIHPSIKTIQALLEQRKKGDLTSEEREIIDDEIKRLNGIVGRFDKTKRKQLKVIFEALKEYALVDIAFDVEGFRLKSDLYNKVHKDRRTGDSERRPMLTLEGAADRVKKNLKKFESRTGDWEDAYLAKRGYSEPISRTQRQYESALKRFRSDEQKFKQNEAKMYKKYCQPSFVMFNQQYHQRRCMKYQQSRSARMQKYLKIRENQLGYIASRKGQYDQLSAWYSSAMQRQASEYEMNDDPFGFYSYTPGGDLGIESDFSLGMPTTPTHSYGRSPAGYQGGGVAGYPIMGPMGGQNPYGIRPGSTPGFVPQPNYFGGGYRPY